MIILGLSGCWYSPENPSPEPTETAVEESTDEPIPSGTTSSPMDPGADPDFSTCTEAVENGYGPYTRDDLEYSYYEDRDGDGTVCEQ